ncbi:hypothetical protein CkaCkLH20_00854 [Colletotrichum karsti]|uniref:Uncharacterized protein n=1 Tax=Colletotrichum karsti TaxID=1095194 RepID=A0A9P6IDT2_9PEZI|nr:uncharacterized protein CkaCkLH20_00854 [Colletotrichum karsti]KAF9881708.1 hypothetical protein CkaCkLH20_00854 [Colletotrichum karsti]
MWSSFRDNLTDAYGAIDAAEAARTAATSLIRFLEPVRALLEDFNQQAKYTLVYIAICKVIWDTWASSAADNGTTSQISKAEDTDATPREDNIVNDSQNHKKRRPTWKQLVEHTAFFITLYTWPTVHWESCRFMKEYCAIPVLSWLGFRPGGQIMSTPQWLLSPAIVILIPWITLTGYLDNTSRPVAKVIAVECTIGLAIIIFEKLSTML